MIEYKDFVPQLIRTRKGLGEPDFESLQEAVAACNAWIGQNDVEVHHIETVVLPNVHHPFEEGSEDVNIRQDDELVTPWNQFVRLWFTRR